MIRKLFLFSVIIVLISAFVPKKKKEFLPPGTAKINDTLFADETEISNFSWQEYEFWMKRKYGANSIEHISTLPDTLVWREKYTDNEPYVQHYYRHSAYKDYPVIGISYEQVVAFCKWRTERVKEFICLSKKYAIIEFEYRLPTKWEWEFVSNNGTGYFSKGGKDEKGNTTSNHVRMPSDTIGKNEYISENADVTTPVYSYWKNLFGLYCMIGNVSEMVLEKGVSKGGSWRHRLEQCRVGKDINYEKPTAWLGFRCVCVVKKKSA
ncbi:MAG: SUMF1/EgtB/PvdO family nonheme iron enzyme [Bacteroidia bacterium]|nr:SUMF1/EgtB/PvdO family nonheme iron enzyme [Bacteroidia bacterium]